MFMQEIRGTTTLDSNFRLTHQVLRVTSLILFILSIVITMLTHGAVYPAAISVALPLMLASLLSAYFGLGVPQRSRRHFHVILGLWTALFLWSLVLAVPMPGFMPAHPAWQSLSEVGVATKRYLSPAPSNVLSALLPLSLPFATALAALLLFRTDEEVNRALYVFGVTGGLLATVAVIQFSLFPQTLMFGEKLFYLDSLTAPFVNRNTAATFYGVTLVALLCQIRLTEVIDLLTWSVRGGSPRKPSSVSVILLLIAAAITFIALMITNSRAGIASSAAGLVVFTAGMLLVPPPGKRRGFASSVSTGRRLRIMQAIGGLLIVVVIFSVFAGRAMLRAEVGGLDDSRFCILPGITNAIRDNLWTGIGPGVFQVYFPAYRDPACGLYGSWEYAHSVYLDGFLAFGIFFWFVVACAVAFAAVSFVQGLRERRSKRPIVWAGIACVFIVLLHSALDFSLQIPGFSVWWATFTALVLTVCTNRLRTAQR